MRSIAGDSPGEMCPQENVRVTCPACEKTALDFTRKPHRYGGRTVLVHCFGCGGGLNEISAASGIPRYRLLRWPPPDELGPPVGRRGPAAGGGSGQLGEASIDGWESALWSDKRALGWLRKRGLTDETIRTYELGYDVDADAIVFPVRDEAGELVNLKRRYLDPAADPKVMGLARPSCLYPIQAVAVDPRALVVSEGEFDALILNQHRIPAITGTAGTHWKPEWNRWIETRQVALLYDAGSYELASRRAEEFRTAGAKDAWPVDLTRAGFAKGEDVTDWFVRYGRSTDELRTFINDARRWYRRTQAA